MGLKIQMARTGAARRVWGFWCFNEQTGGCILIVRQQKETRYSILGGKSEDYVGRAIFIRSDFLTSNGISAIDADTKIGAFCAERNAELRKMGIRNTLIGAPLAVGAGITVYLCLRLGYSSGFLNSSYPDRAALSSFWLRLCRAKPLNLCALR